MVEYTYGKDFAIRTEIDCNATKNDFGQYVGRITAVKIKTNADRIRAMSDEELAHLLHDAEEHLFTGNLWDYEQWREWLKKEVEK